MYARRDITQAKAVVVADKVAVYGVVIIVKIRHLDFQNIQNMVVQ